MVNEYYYTDYSDYVACDSLNCGEAECFESLGQPSCICVDTLTEPDENGLCQQPLVYDIGSGYDSGEEGVIPFTQGLVPGLELVSLPNQIVTESPQEGTILSSTVYLISGSCALILLVVGLFVLFYIGIYRRRQRSRNLDIESDTTRNLSPLLFHGVQTTKVSPFHGLLSKPPPVHSLNNTDTLASFGTFDRRAK